MELSRDEIERYSRQLDIVGLNGQAKLSKARVLIIGVGGLGTPVALYLTATGVGELILVDSERVELSNLNRQILYSTRDIGRLKVEVAAEKLRELNPHVRITTYPYRASRELLEELVKEADLVIDGTDNWETRFLINEFCVKYRKPFIHAGVQGFHGQLMVIVPGVTPCLRCIIPFNPSEKDRVLVLPTTPGILGLLQATEAIKIITGVGVPSLNKLLVFDGYNMRLHEVQVSRNPKCPVCGHIMVRSD